MPTAELSLKINISFQKYFRKYFIKKYNRREGTNSVESRSERLCKYKEDNKYFK